MELTNEQKERQLQWQERTKHYPYNVLAGIYSIEIEMQFNEQFDYETFEQDLANDIEQSIAKLPESLRYVFILYVKEELSYDKIAKQEELPKAVVLDRLALTWRHLRHPKYSKRWQA